MCLGPLLGLDVTPNTAFCPGLGAAVNCNLALLTVEKGRPNYDTTGLLPVGGEVFKVNGDCCPTNLDYPAAKELVEEYNSLKNKMGGMSREVWDLVAHYAFPSRILHGWN